METPEQLQGYHTSQALGNLMMEAQAQQCSQEAEDFTDLDQLGFLQVCGPDRQGRPVVLVCARQYAAHMLQPAKTRRYLEHKLADVVHQQYTLVWVHTEATYWKNCPSAWWLWRTYETLPSTYRENLAMVHVLHCSLMLWGAVLAFLPWWSNSLWSKINWIQRVEFLWEWIDKKCLLPHLPAYVLEHDEDLETQPLADYGIVAASEATSALMEAPLSHLNANAGDKWQVRSGESTAVQHTSFLSSC